MKLQNDQDDVERVCFIAFSPLLAWGKKARFTLELILVNCFPRGDKIYPYDIMLLGCYSNGLF